MKKIEINQEAINKIAEDFMIKQNKEFEGYEGKIIYRPHGGGSVFDSLEKAKEFNTIQEMKEYVVEQWDNLFSDKDVVITNEFVEDGRIDWKDVRHVCIKRLGKDNYISKYGTPQCIGYCATEYPSKA
jgi:hypothetical protein